MKNALIAISAGGFPKIGFVFFLCLVFFGAKRLPELACDGHEPWRINEVKGRN